MSKVENIWRKFLKSVITDTFSEFLDQKQIDERVDWIISKIHSVIPEVLFKNVLFMMNNNALSEIAVGYKLHFLLDDYKELFINPSSEEFDNNDNLSTSDKDLINMLIENFTIAINHHIELLINKHKEETSEDITNLILVVNQLSNHYKLPRYETMSSQYIQDGVLLYRMSFGQILYMVAFNQNPFSNTPCSNDISIVIRDRYPSWILMLPTEWGKGIGGLNPVYGKVKNSDTILIGTRFVSKRSTNETLEDLIKQYYSGRLALTYPEKLKLNEKPQKSVRFSITD